MPDLKKNSLTDEQIKLLDICAKTARFNDAYPQDDAEIAKKRNTLNELGKAARKKLENLGLSSTEIDTEIQGRRMELASQDVVSASQSRVGNGPSVKPRDKTPLLEETANGSFSQSPNHFFRKG